MRHVLARRWTFAPTWVQRSETSHPVGAKVRNFAPISVLWRTVPGAVLVHDCHTSHEPPRSDRRSPLSRLSPASRGGASCLKKTVSLEEVQPRNSRTRPGQRKPRTPPTDASHADGRVGGGRRPAAHAAAGPARSVRGSKARRQPLWVTHTHQAGRRRCRGAARGTKMAGRGASRQSRHRRLPRFSSDAVPHRLAKCSRARRGGVGDAGGIEPACTDAPDGARPRGERKDALDTVARRRCRAQVAYVAAAVASSVGVKPQVEASGAGCAAQRASSAPSPPHLHSTRARSAPSIRAAGTSWPNLGV
jgi:hypothetical protein